MNNINFNNYWFLILLAIICWFSWLFLKLAEATANQLTRHHDELLDKIDKIINKL